MINKKRFASLLVIGLVFGFCFACATKNISSIQSLSAQKQSSDAIIVAENLYLPPQKDFRIVVISDLNSQYGSIEYEPEVEQAIALIPKWQPDLVLCGGDMIAGQKASLTQTQIEAMWAAFDRQIAMPLRQHNIPFGFTIGNHDGSGAIKNQTLIFERERDLATAYWNQEQHRLGLNFIDRANFPFYYSFQQNDIFFLVWDASSQNIAQQQLVWVKQMLNSPAAKQARVKIVIGHLPLFAVAQSKNKPGEYLANGSQLRSLLETNKVQVYISGHHHVYYPGKQGDLELLHAGALGQGERQLINSDLLPRKTLTVIDIEKKTAQLTYHTYDASTWELISLEQLPTSITGESGTIIRRDLSE